MRKFLGLAAAAALTVGVSLSVATPSTADPAGDAIGGAVVGGMLGFMAGAAAANSPPPHAYVDEDDDYAAHVRACKRAYHWRYDVESDTYHARDGYDYPCDL
jgi:hypothetical protein